MTRLFKTRAVGITFVDEAVDWSLVERALSLHVSMVGSFIPMTFASLGLSL